MPSKHATVGGSNLSRAMACPPSIMLEQQFPNKTSKYAEEGTTAHEMCELKLKQKFFMKRKSPKLKALIEEQPKEMNEATEVYVDTVTELYNEALATSAGAVLYVEQEVDFSEYVPDGFGTADAVIATESRLTVIDFKYGKGVPVEAEGNAQLRIYAVGSYLKLNCLYDFEEVHMVIVQPRLNSISEDIISVEELLTWAEEKVKPAATLAMKGEGEFNPGDHCRFCRASALCRARAAKVQPVITHSKDLKTLGDDEIPALMALFEETRAWMDSVESYAQEKAVSDGVKWDGFKLVEARTIRKITDPIEAVNRLDKLGLSADEYTTQKLKGIGELERLLGKSQFSAVLGDLIVKPQGEPTLVKESDKRPEINPAALAFKEV